MPFPAFSAGHFHFFFRYTAGNLQVTLFKYALSAPANKNFQKQTIFALTES